MLDSNNSKIKNTYKSNSALSLTSSWSRLWNIIHYYHDADITRQDGDNILQTEWMNDPLIYKSENEIGKLINNRLWLVMKSTETRDFHSFNLFV